MEKKINITANILFSGIGCQERGFRDSGIFNVKVLNTSDINKESVLSYAAIHCGLTNEMVNTYQNYPSKEEMAQHLTDINLGYEPEKNKKFNWFKLVKRKKNDLEKYWLACRLTRNLGDITRIKELPYADFWTCSFPCTDISISGKMKGLDPDSNTRSSLLWDNIRLLKTSKANKSLPKYLMFENVKNLLSKKFINNFHKLLEMINELGFNSYWSVINGKDCGVPQSRERVFVISIRRDIDNGSFTFPKPFNTGIKLKDVLEGRVNGKYFLPDEKVQEFLEEFRVESFFETINKESDILSEREKKLILKQLRQNIRIRKLTPRECFKLMGFIFDDCDRASALGVADTHLYSQAGNGIITNCCKLLAEHLYKAQYDSTFICTDEKYQEVFGRITDNMKPFHNKREPVLLGGIGSKNFGKQYRQGNRVYDSNAVAMCLTAQPLGNAGGYSYLYAITEGGHQRELDIGCDKLKEPKEGNNAHRIKGWKYSEEGCANPSIQKENHYIAIGAAMRGRYAPEGGTKQQIELRNDEISNAVTTIQKDSLVVEIKKGIPGLESHVSLAKNSE